MSVDQLDGHPAVLLQSQLCIFLALLGALGPLLLSSLGRLLYEAGRLFRYHTKDAF
jgi:hypothetical protein